MSKNTAKKTHWKKMHNYEYLGSYSIENDNDLILTIKSTQQKEVIGTSGRKEICFVLFFKENVKPMIANRTNCKAIQKALNTPYVEEWIGRSISIYVASVSAFGTTTDALRIRDYEPQPAKVDNTAAIKAIKACKDIKILQSVYMNLSGSLKADKDVIKAKDDMKVKLLNPETIENDKA